MYILLAQNVKYCYDATKSDDNPTSEKTSNDARILIRRLNHSWRTLPPAPHSKWNKCVLQCNMNKKFETSCQCGLAQSRIH